MFRNLLNAVVISGLALICGCNRNGAAPDGGSDAGPSAPSVQGGGAGAPAGGAAGGVPTMPRAVMEMPLKEYLRIKKQGGNLPQGIIVHKEDGSEMTPEEIAEAESGLSKDEIAGVKQLPEVERAAAFKQVKCPISGDNLGEMGMPFKVTFEGKTAYLCCKSCKKDFDADPAAAFAKLETKKK